jgi:hypothetical protein
MPRRELSATERGAVRREAPHEVLPISPTPKHAADVPVPAFEPTIEGAISPAIARIAQEVARLERARADAATPPDVAQAQAVERARRVQRAAAQERHDRASTALDAALTRTFADPARARAALLAAAQSEGLDAVVARLRERPETYGTLAAVERTRGFGLVRGRDDAAARQAAREAATLTHEYVAARQILDAGRPSPAVRPPHAVTDGPARCDGRDDQDRGVSPPEERAAHRAGSPAATMLERGLRDAVRKLTPAELQQLHALLTRPQVALAMRLRNTVRDAVMGRESGE